MAGVYIHVPFCRQRCHYCNFYATASTKYRDSFVEALVSEINARAGYLNNQPVNTIYIGGGTPSLLSAAELKRILDAVKNKFNVQTDVEITLEANPDDLTDDKLNALKNETPVSRLSIGIQSFFDDDLAYLNRVHNAKQAGSSIEMAQKLGFDNLTIDLIYGIPTLTDAKWKENLNRFFGYQLPHLSSYALTVEPKTSLDVLINKGKMQAVDEEQSIRHFEILVDETVKRNYIHYEISNFALEGYYSKHNSIYWLGGHYIGLGPSAHSFNGYSRQWNVSNMKQYTEAGNTELFVAEQEILSTSQRYNEYVMTSLRTRWGCDTEHINNVFGNDYLQYFNRVAASFVDEKKVYCVDNRYFLTEKGKLFADAIASGLFV